MKPCRFVLVLLSIVGRHAAWSASVDLGISIDAPPGPTALNSNLVYTIVVTNAASVRATGVIVTNEFVNLAFVSAGSSQGSCSHSEGVISCNLGNMNAGSTATISVRLQPTTEGPMDLVAIVQANQVDSVPENNTAW